MDTTLTVLFTDAIEDLSKRAETHDEGDYTGEDGLLYCGNCRTPKQHRITVFGKQYTVFCSCKCKTEAYKQRQREWENEQKMVRIDELRKLSLMDKRFQASTFDSFEVTDENRMIYKKALGYAENFDAMYERGNGLLFTGDTGSGKSFTAACIANYLLDRMVPVVVTSFIKLLNLIRPYGDDDEREESVIDRINAAKLLVIDDLGTEAGTDTQLARVYNIVDSRYRSGKPLIVTTNLTHDELVYCGDTTRQRIYNRILETCYPVEFPAIGWRERNAFVHFEEMDKLLGLEEDEHE